MDEVYIGIGVFVSLFAALLVWLDANNRNEENAGWWVLGTFLLLIIVLPIYLYHRAYGNKAYHDYNMEQESKFAFHGNGRKESNIQGFGKVTCPKCNSRRTSTYPWTTPQGHTEGHKCLDCQNVWTT